MKDSIDSSLNTVDRVVKDTGLRYEIVVVDDGSIDHEVEGERHASRNRHMRLIGYDRNRGSAHP
jgi:glycosyltransferase involved in cell wall biosynthesis